MVAIPHSQTFALVQTLQWVFDPVGYMEKNFQRFGGFFRAEISPVNPEPIVFVNHPEAIQSLLSQDNSDELSAPGEVNALLKPLFGENSLLLLSGKQHRQRRQLMVPPFHGERMKAYGDLICAITQEVMDQWQVGQRFCAREAMQKITMQVILQAVFGLYEGDRYQRLEYLLAERLNLISTPLSSVLLFFPQLTVDLGPWSIGGRVRRLVEETDQLLYAEIRERRAQPNVDRTDVLSLLLAAKDADGKGLTDEELHDELMTLLVAGHETTATALAWALYWIHHRPEVHQTLTAELEQSSDMADLMAISRLPYLTAVCSETLRIYPVAMVTLPRRVEKPMQLMGYDLEVGSLLLGCIYLVHHNEALYPNAHEFQPERFLERQFSPSEFLPFGGGSRRCIGAALAMYEMTLVLRTILSQCELQLAEPKAVKPQRRGGTLAPKGSVQIRKVGDRSQVLPALETPPESAGNLNGIHTSR
ncbi:MAG: cytochrome P450 [Stenomitos rutilans HA7619-LM2]|jgi:cytochrome P450|nr:cytochrome P450 [Stenomitos rutilans HA7619-LM2]